MAHGTSPTGNVGTHYGDTSVVLDVSQYIFQETPEDTPFFELCDNKAAEVTAVYHNWQIRDLVTRQDNASVEGFTYAFTGQRLPTRIGNVLQIPSTDIRVSNTNQAINHYGIPNLRADQVETKLTELKTDIELALLRGSANTGASGVARRMLGIIPMITANVTAGGGYTNGTAATFSESIFNGMLEVGWTRGAALRDVLVDGRMKRVISNFTGNATRVINADAGRLVQAIDQIDTEFGPVSLHLCRDLQIISSGTSAGRQVLAVDKSHLAKAWLRPITVQKAAAIADSEDYIAVTELTLEYGHPCAHSLYNNFASPI